MTKSIDYPTYDSIVDILHQKKYNAEEVVVQLAKRHPKVFLDIIEHYEPDWKTEVRAIHNSNNKIECIKLCRELTGWSLATAKAAIEENFNFILPR
tara:strand:+ start:4860 stop:5147 length:288 start_codon:yes stop_codon:yes gene_type:complete